MKEINNERLICPGIYQDGSSIRIDLSLYFSDSDAIPATVFAESVAGLNRMANQARDAIVALLGIDNPDKTALYLETVRNGSKFTDFIFRVFLGSDEDAARTADALHERFGVNRLMESKCIQNILIAAVIAYCVQGVVREFVPAEKANAAIEATNSVIINAGRDLNIAPERLEYILREKIPSPLKAGKGAVQALQPAVMKEDTVVKVGGRNGIEIPRVVIENMPSPADITTKERPNRIDIDNIRIQVLASDIDRRKTGWAVRLPEDSICPGRRLKAILDDTINPADLMYQAWRNASISIYMSPDGRPQHVLIRAILDENAVTDTRPAAPSTSP